jgi:hypothetical protein
MSDRDPVVMVPSPIELRAHQMGLPRRRRSPLWWVHVVVVVAALVAVLAMGGLR